MTTYCSGTMIPWRVVTLASGITLVAGAASPVVAQTLDVFELNRSRLVADTPAEPISKRVDVESAEPIENGRCPFSFGLSYALYSDYIFRGVNFSEYDGEGREKPNHQLTVSLAYDLGDFGSIGYDAWFEWYAAQAMLDPDRGGQNLQEVDHTVWWSKDLDAIDTTLTLGMTFYQFVNLAHTNRQDGAYGNNNDDRTQEWWLRLEHNDAWLWQGLLPDNEKGVLNPSLFFAHDVGAFPGVWMEFGLSHGFSIPNVDNLTITPGWTLCVDGDYLSDGFNIALQQFSLALEYDLTPVLQLPEWAGTISITGELYYNDALGSLENDGVIQDEFWGGMSVNWAWGG